MLGASPLRQGRNHRLAGPQRKPALSSFEGIDELRAESGKVAFISCGYFESVDAGGGCNHGVLEEMLGLSFHQPHPFAEAGSVHRQDVVGSLQLIQPGLDRKGLSCILLSSLLDAPLQFSTVTAEIYTWSSRNPAIQARTPPCGLGLRSSETTLVSSRNRVT